jgi:hypothetical protein
MSRNRTEGEKAADDFKGHQAPFEKRERLAARAEEILRQAQADMANGLFYFTEEGIELLTTEAVLAHRLAGHRVTTSASGTSSEKGTKT